MGKQSQSNGKNFEIQLCYWLKENGYYPEYHEKSVSGSQSSDVTAIKNNIAFKIECKNLSSTTGRFPLSRIEMNQSLSYRAYRDCHNTNYVLAICWNDCVYFLDFGIIQFFKKSIDLKELEPSITNWSEFVDGLKRK